MNQEASYFVRVSDPLHLKRALLEINKELLVALSKYERFKQIRKQRQASVAELKEMCTKINGLMGELRKHLPKLSTSIGDEQLKKRIKKANEPVKPKSQTELDKIESKIKELESQMEKLG